MVGLRAAVFAALLIFSFAKSSFAQDVTLTSRDGAVEISGTLLGFDGEFFRVETKYGELTVDGTGVLCDGPGCPNMSNFVAQVAFSGSSTMAEVLLPALVEGFALRNGLKTRRDTLDDAHFNYTLFREDPQRDVAQFTFRVTNTNEGFADLLANEADVVLALREIRPSEKARAYEAGMGDMTGPRRSRVLALDAMVPVVAPNNPVQRISIGQLADILAGTITNWTDLGGPDAPILVHLPVPGSGLAQAAEDQLLGPGKLSVREDSVRHARTSLLAGAVAADPFALGLTSFAETGLARALTLTGHCGYSLSASRRTIKTEDYPLSSPMFLYLPVRRLPKIAREFLVYVSSPAAQLVIRRSGFVDQTPEEIPINEQGDRFANAILAAGPEVPLDELKRMMETLEPMSRLTLSFRFEAGSSRPDAQSRSNVVRLARAIESGVFDARRLLFVGFSDGDGPAKGNRVIAGNRAEAVRRAVIASADTGGAARTEMEVAAFGEALPMACDDSEWGRKVNRRVEVWVR